MIKQEFGVRYHPAHISRLLRACGWSVQRPIKRATIDNPERRAMPLSYLDGISNIDFKVVGQLAQVDIVPLAAPRSRLRARSELAQQQRTVATMSRYVTNMGDRGR